MTINLKALTKSLVDQRSTEVVKMESKSIREIAVIGVSCRFGGANSKEEFWSSLIRGEDHIRDFPLRRRQLMESYLQKKKIFADQDSYYQAGFLNQVDAFDSEFFSISPLEASLMSADQRLFLEAAWEAIEDAGYGGGLLKGTPTGVFLGHSTDFGLAYKELVETLHPQLASVSISGNLHSIIASRIAYLLDLKGPSMVVDTACSSSLVAVHQACRAIRSGDCDIALAGSVKVDLLPLTSIKMTKQDELGITSPDGRARTFDESSKGTGLGEGVAAVLLKPLSKAIEDGDNIYAVIKGSMYNQDGASAGLTAPNPAAQEDMIEKAWKNASVDPKTISYIEAHGTGTNLGDPIEITGIERAFAKYTEKKQFCAIGSVKTNLGHLDHAAGMAGLIKAILSLQNKQLPPTLHFQEPNRKINFEASPLYVNDQLRPWTTDGFPRRCGVSAFGLSGTNCHIVLEEAPPVHKTVDVQPGAPYFITLSAKRKEGVLELIRQYQLFLHNQVDTDMGAICRTANAGRGHYSHRLAILFHDKADLQAKLEKAAAVELDELREESIFYGEHRVISENQLARKKGEWTESEKSQLSRQVHDIVTQFPAQINEIAALYAAGADVEWPILYRSQRSTKQSLPTYPFSKTSCWVEKVDTLPREERSEAPNFGDAHPLFDVCLAESFDRVTYRSTLSAGKYWLLNEQVMSGRYVAPGTLYIEMAVELAGRYFPERTIQLSDVQFVFPLAVKKGKTIEVQTLLTKKNSYVEFVVMSKSEQSGRWTKHAEGKIIASEPHQANTHKVETLKEICSGDKVEHYLYQTENDSKTDPRWECIVEAYSGEREMLALLSLNDVYKWDGEEYNLHPALLDAAVNLALRNVGEDLYLPFSYKNIKVLGNLPAKLYSYVKRTDSGSVNSEFASFDIMLLDESGVEVAVIEEYTIKRESHRSGSAKRGSERIIGELNDQHSSLNDRSLGFELCAEIRERQDEIEGFGTNQVWSENRLPKISVPVVLQGRADEDSYTEWEQRIASVYSNVLGLKEINIYDSFLDIGGNSILAVKVEADFEKEEIPLRLNDLMEYQTINGLAEQAAKISGHTSAADRSVPETVSAPHEPSRTVEQSSRRLERVEPFNEVFYIDCFHNSLFSVIHHFERKTEPFSGNDIFFYAKNGMDNRFSKTIQELLTEQGIHVRTKAHVSHKEQDTVVTEEDMVFLDQFSKRVGMEKTDDPSEDISELIPSIKRALTKGRPVIIWVDCFYEPIRKDTFNKMHWMHSLLLYGYDDKEELFHVIEHIHRDNLNYKQQTISYKDLLRSYEAFIVNYFPYSQMPAYYEFYTQNQAVCSAECVETNARLAYWDMRNRHQDQILGGLEEIRAFNAMFLSMLHDEDALKAKTNHFIEILNSIINSKQADLFNVKSLFGVDCEWLVDMQQLLERWIYIRQILVKYMYTSIFKMGNVSEYLQLIYPAEIRLYEKLLPLFKQ